MSLDIVDDLHAAEDRIGSLQQRLEELARSIHQLSHAFDFDVCQEPVCIMNRTYLTPFVRPTCADGECDEDCGGYHLDRD